VKTQTGTKEMSLRLLTDEDALEHVQSRDFQSRWMALHDCCPWATACQHPDFVVPWYELYFPVYFPVIVLDENEDGSLNGVLTLALRRNGTRITGAGDQQAEYQGWIEAPVVGNNFIQNALKKIRDTFPSFDICLKYLPPGIPLTWLNEQGSYRKYCSLRSHARPIMKIDEAAMERQRNKKNHRQNYNRLRKVGPVQFESVVEHDRFIQVFDEMCTQYDFRQGALYHYMPFASDPFKKPFYLELHKRGMLHTSILTVDGKIAASHLGMLSRARAVHLGINTHDPAFAAHSPGGLLLAMLGVHLATENLPVLDLTPGGDGYKEHFATDHDTVFELIIYSDIERRLRTDALRSVMRFSKTGLRMAGYRPKDVLTAFDKLKNLGARGWRKPWGKSRRQALSRHCELRYSLEPPENNTHELLISKDHLNDVLKFDASDSSTSHWDFLSTVMKRMERSNHLYSFVQDKKLLIFCWAKTCSAESVLQKCWQESAPAGNSIVLFDLYVHRHMENSDLVRRFVAQILNNAGKAEIDGSVFYRGDLHPELQMVLKTCGFIDESG
jgi:CelD/BcsL family acetyltransferase involved in cellulose biosynthesis